MTVKNILLVSATLQILCDGFMQTPATPTTRMPNTKAYSSRSDKQSDDLFDMYDADGNGQIDREEFRAVAKKMKSSSRRREVISVGAAAFGSIFVATGSDTFQFAQKKLRTNYLEEAAEAAQKAYFPTAMLSADLDKAIFKTLKSRDFTPDNTLFGHSVCADEVNNRKEQLIPLMTDRWEEGFALGG